LQPLPQAAQLKKSVRQEIMIDTPEHLKDILYDFCPEFSGEL
jgi:hypothetical protein